MVNRSVPSTGYTLSKSSNTGGISGHFYIEDQGTHHRLTDLPLVGVFWVQASNREIAPEGVLIDCRYVRFRRFELVRPFFACKARIDSMHEIAHINIMDTPFSHIGIDQSVRGTLALYRQAGRHRTLDFGTSVCLIHRLREDASLVESCTEDS